MRVSFRIFKYAAGIIIAVLQRLFGRFLLKVEWSARKALLNAQHSTSDIFSFFFINF